MAQPKLVRLLHAISGGTRPLHCCPSTAELDAAQRHRGGFGHEDQVLVPPDHDDDTTVYVSPHFLTPPFICLPGAPSLHPSLALADSPTHPLLLHACPLSHLASSSAPAPPLPLGFRTPPLVLVPIPPSQFPCPSSLSPPFPAENASQFAMA
ncbi:hypothetical protein B0H14DRAFT_3428458 [Mycena olivaceomarginata]|nr:hypothetical protein B0H14DRAFT_3428458 [Mycena olivaceomarginata]